MKSFKYAYFLLPSVFIFMLLISLGCVRPYDFSIAVIADPHCAGVQEHWDRIDSAIKWINDNRDEKKIGLVVIVGDMAWGSDNLLKIRTRFDGLSVPYLPVIGDNEIHGNDEITFNDVFSSHFDNLAVQFADSWNKAPVPVQEPETAKDLYLQNYSLDYNGLHIICTDWNTRSGEGFPESEQAELFDFEGGTWPWLKDDIENSIGAAKNNILVFSHHPMHVSPVYPLIQADLGAFSLKDFRTITGFTLAYQDYIFASYAGHYHVPMQQNIIEGGYMLYVVRSIHQPSQLKNSSLLKEPTIKLINVAKKGDSFSYQNLLVNLDKTGNESITEEP